MNSAISPVVVFAYNRPEHLRQTLTALAEAELASQTRVRVYADGPRDQTARDPVLAVRTVLEDPLWRDRFAAFEIVASDENNGLARAIIGGVTEVIKRAGRVIVLEDDLIVSRDFLRFMNDALDYYRDDASVGSISGFCPLKAPPTDYPHDVMRVPRNCSHGWATWADRWREVDWTAAHAGRLSREPALRQRFDSAGSDRFDRLQRQLEGKINSWSIRFGLWQVISGRDTIYPVHNRVRNIGFDDSGVHTRRGQVVNDAMVRDGAPYVLTDPPASAAILRAFSNIYSGSPMRGLMRKIRELVLVRSKGRLV